ncbi:MAG: type II secretion system F family protein [Acidimicrobiaceae bacterium]|nr:type II secretion system F family protein [Acidimicrobiaceae bacterium]
MDEPPVPQCGVLVVSLAATAAVLLVLLSFGLGMPTGRAVRRRLRSRSEKPLRRPGATDGLAAIGRRLSRGAVDPQDEFLVGAAALAAPVAVVALGATGGLLVLFGVVTAVVVRRRARRRKHLLQVDRHLPEVVDLLGLVISTGRPTAAAFADIAPRVAEPFGSELAAVVRRCAAGEPFVDAVRRLRDGLGGAVSPVVHAVTAAEMDGTPLRPALQRAADEAHRRRRVRAQEAARRAPVLMLFPLVFCVLPAFGLLTVVPLLLGAVSELRLTN